jgi:hypothetical protein
MVVLLQVRVAVVVVVDAVVSLIALELGLHLFSQEVVRLRVVRLLVVRLLVLVVVDLPICVQQLMQQIVQALQQHALETD